MKDRLQSLRALLEFELEELWQMMVLENYARHKSSVLRLYFLVVVFVLLLFMPVASGVFSTTHGKKYIYLL